MARHSVLVWTVSVVLIVCVVYVLTLYRDTCGLRSLSSHPVVNPSHRNSNFAQVPEHARGLYCQTLTHALENGSAVLANTPILIIDSILFLNELELLEIRLNELAHVVDYFIIVESNETFTGFPKPYLLRNHPIMNMYSSQIVYVECVSLPAGAWQREAYSRECIKHGLSRIGAPTNNTYLMVGDLDEIPSSWLLQRLRHCDIHHQGLRLRQAGSELLLGFRQARYHFNFHCRSVNMFNWQGTVIASATYITTLGIEGARARRGKATVNTKLLTGGWHFSNFPFGNASRLVEKYRAFSHQEITQKVANNPEQYWASVMQGGDQKTNTHCEEHTLWILPRLIFSAPGRFADLLNAQQLQMIEHYNQIK